MKSAIKKPQMFILKLDDLAENNLSVPLESHDPFHNNIFAIKPNMHCGLGGG